MFHVHISLSYEEQKKSWLNVNSDLNFLVTLIVRVWTCFHCVVSLNEQRLKVMSDVGGTPPPFLSLISSSRGSPSSMKRFLFFSYSSSSIILIWKALLKQKKQTERLQWEKRREEETSERWMMSGSDGATKQLSENHFNRCMIAGSIDDNSSVSVWKLIISKYFISNTTWSANPLAQRLTQ